MKRFLALLLMGSLGAGAALVAQSARSAADLFQEGLQFEEVKGDLPKAIATYQSIVDTFAGDRAIAAKALLHMGECYEKLGQPDAQKVYERLLRDYPEQKEAAEALAHRDRDSARKAQDGPLAQRVWAAEEAGKDYSGNVAVEVAPDGAHAVFADWKSGNLAIRDLKTGATRLLTQDRDGPCPQDLIFSPDGKQIAYRCDGMRTPQPLRIVQLESAHLREISVREDGLFIFKSSWSPDGKLIAATKYSEAEKAHGVALIAVSNGSITRLKSAPWGTPPTIAGGFSSDSRFLAYSVDGTRSQAKGGIFAIAVDGSRETALVQSEAEYADPIWTPDGRGVVFLSNRSGTRDLWFIPVADGRPQGEPVVVRPDVGKIDLKGFTRDGALYYGTNQLDSDLYQIEFNSGRVAAAPKRLSDRLIGANFEPEPSPDGKMLAFFRGNPRSPHVWPATLVVRPTAGGEDRILLNDVNVDYQRRCIRWFPDGRSLLLHDWKSFRRVDLQTGTVQTLFEFPDPIWMHADVSQDGKALFYSRRPPGVLSTKRLIRRDLETGEEKVLYQVESDQAALYGISLSPDGTRLAFMTSDRVDNQPFRVLVTMPAEGGEVKEVYRAKGVAGVDEALHWWGAAWSRDGRYILATRSMTNEKQSDELVAFPVDGGGPRVLATMPGQIHNPTASPDGRHILFTSARRSLELWVMRNFLPQSPASR